MRRQCSIIHVLRCPLCMFWEFREVFLAIALQRRCFQTSALALTRFGGQAPKSTLRELGKFMPAVENGTYPIGQVFLHKLYGYCGIIMLSSYCTTEHKITETSAKVTTKRPFYQTLIDRKDWPTLPFAINLTTYLSDDSLMKKKSVAYVNGMDCVFHDDVLPIKCSEYGIFEHDLFDRIFTSVAPSVGHADYCTFIMRPELERHYLLRKQTKWLTPTHAYKDVIDQLEVMITTFYVGYTNNVYIWRYVMRFRNLVPDKAITLRERSIKIFSANNLHHFSGTGVGGQLPTFSMDRPVSQFSSNVELPAAKGCHFWGKFIMEREDGSIFNVTIPAIALELPSDDSS